MKKGNVLKLIIFAIVIIGEVLFVICGFWFLFQFTKVVFGAEEIVTEDYTVLAGETLWDIATEHKKDGQDIREYIYELRKINNIDDCIIHPNQVIKIIK